MMSRRNRQARLIRLDRRFCRAQLGSDFSIEVTQRQRTLPWQSIPYFYIVKIRKKLRPEDSTTNRWFFSMLIIFYKIRLHGDESV